MVTRDARLRAMRRIMRWIRRVVGFSGDLHFSWEVLLPLGIKWIPSVMVALYAWLLEDLGIWSLVFGAGVLLLFSLMVEGILVMLGKYRRWMSSPVWVERPLRWDRENLKSTLHQMDERQHGNVAFSMDDEHRPSVSVAFRYVNASVFTMIFESIEGPLQIEGDVVSGAWDFRSFEVPHGQTFGLKLRWVVNTDASVSKIKQLISTGEKVHVNLDAVRLSIRAKEEPGVTAKIGFPQQWWQPREDEIARLVTVEFRIARDHFDTVLCGIVHNVSARALTGVQVRVERSELIAPRQSDGAIVPHDFEIQQCLLPWIPEGSTEKNIGPFLHDSRFEVIRLPENSPIASLPGKGSGDTGGEYFTEAGCHRLTLSIHADNLAPITKTVDFRIQMGHQPGQRILLEQCEG